MAQSYDAIVIGGGHNGLVSAAYLSKAGLRTLVLEQRHVLGGAAVTEEIFPGFRFSVFSYVVSLLRPEIIRDLQLPKHGLDILPLDGTITPLHEGEGPKTKGDAGGEDHLVGSVVVGVRAGRRVVGAEGGRTAGGEAHRQGRGGGADAREIGRASCRARV